MDNGASPLKVAENLAAMEIFIKEFRKDQRYVHYLRDELQKHHGRFTTEGGAVIEACEAGVSFDYSHDAEWCTLKAQFDGIAHQLRAREELLRKAKPGRQIVDPDTGEMITGATKTSTSTYRVTIKK